MRRFAILLFMICIFGSVQAYQIGEFEFDDRMESATNTVLNYFHEYYPGKEWTLNELGSALTNFKQRLVTSGWYKEVNISFQKIASNEVKVNVDVEDSFAYRIWTGDLYFGLSKINLWGRGKEVAFEIGPIQQKIVIADNMFQYSKFFFKIALGTEEHTYTSMTNGLGYVENKVQRRIGEFTLGYRLFPDAKLKAMLRNYKLEYTNNVLIDNYNMIGLEFEYDKRVGYPNYYKGWNGVLDLYYIHPQNAFKAELFANYLYPIQKSIILKGRAHAGFITGDVPSYQKISLRNIDGLRTLSDFDGMIGDICWDAHFEVLWAFWDAIPFLFIFELQLEALAFLDVGEARASFSDLGRPHWTYGAGLRIYMETFIVRTELGIDELGNSYVLSSMGSSF